MRKVFVSNVIIGEMRSIPYQSRDFDLGGKKFSVPICYLLDANIEPGDEVLIVTGMTQTKKIQQNYTVIEEEMRGILAAHHATAEFVTVNEPDADEERDKQDSLTFSTFLKEISDLLKDGDRIYADMSYGLRIYTLATFIAMSYALKACKDVRIEVMVYGQAFKGKEKFPQVVDIVDITTLAHISSIVSNLKPGQKEEMDRFMGLLMG